MFASYRAYSLLPAATLGIFFLLVPVLLIAQSLPPALESPAARPPQVGPHDLKLQMKIEKGGGGGIQYRSVTGVPWSRLQPTGLPRAAVTGCAVEHRIMVGRAA